jgi:hypothetical protein
MKMPTKEEINKLPVSLSHTTVAAYFGISTDQVISARKKAVKPSQRKPRADNSPGMDSASLTHLRDMRLGSAEFLRRTLKLIAKRNAELRFVRKDQAR